MDSSLVSRSSPTLPQRGKWINYYIIGVLKCQVLIIIFKKGVRLIESDKALVKEYKGKTYDLNRAAIIFTVPCGLIVFLQPPIIPYVS